jgi:integrase
MSLATISTFDLSIEQIELLQKTMAYERASLSSNTLRSYKSMWKKFEGWCLENKQVALPASAETVALYISNIGESVSFSTLDSVLAAIEAVHEKAGLQVKGDNAIYRRVRKGIRRTHKENQLTRQAPALTVLDLKGVCCNLGDDLKGTRDRALITTAFFGAFRRSEVASLDVEHIEFNEQGATVSLMQSKTSDTKQVVYLSYAKDNDICPVKALKRWLEASKIYKGAVFRYFMKGEKIGERISGHSISEVIKRHFGKRYSGHSARRGLVTASAEKGTSLHVIKKHSRHKSANMVLRYIDDAKGFEDSAVAVLGV